MIKRGLWLGPVLLALLVNVNVLQNGFGWDDESGIPNLRIPDDVGQIVSLFLPHPTGKQDVPYFRPVAEISYLFDYALWRDNPFGFHLSVLLGHLLNTALVFFLARGLQRAQCIAPLRTLNSQLPNFNLLPLLAASLFAVHPVHAEAVAWIAGRNDVFCAVFLLLSVLLYLRFHRTGSGWTYGFSMLSFFLALLTKETAIGLILLFPLYEFLAATGPAESRMKRMAARWILPLGILGLYLWMRAGGITNTYGGAFSPELSPVSGLWVAIRAYAYYFTMVLFPYPHRPFVAAR
jgi:hypothetical protein